MTADTKPPRPRVTVPGLLLVGGAILLIIGTFLPWVRGNGLSFNGWDLYDINQESSDAGAFVAFGVILGGFGIALVAAGRVLAVAILAVIVAAFAAIAAFVDVTDDDDLSLFGFETAFGLYVILVGALIALAGSIWALAIRRR